MYFLSWACLAMGIAGAAALTAVRGWDWKTYLVGAGPISLANTAAGWLLTSARPAPPLGQHLMTCFLVCAVGIMILSALITAVVFSVLVVAWACLSHLAAVSAATLCPNAQ